MKKVKIIIIILLSIISSLVIGFASWYFFINKTLLIKNFDEMIVVPVFSEYQNDKLDICYGSKFNCKKLDYKITSDVDISVLGNYTVTYQYNYGNKSETLTQSVKIVDEEKPVITTNGAIKVCNNGKIISDNFEAIDNYDGDLTSKINYLNDNGDYLEVTDSSGNTTRILVEAIVGDDVSPSITLTGGTVYLKVGGTYKEPGYKASDNCDGDITSSIKVTNNINNKKTGNYQVTYIVKDSSGNEKKVIRKVNVFKKNSVVTPTNKTIYLTFDDGPCSYTGKLLKILNEYNVKATFFVTNQFPAYQKYIKEAHLAGHSIGVHTYSHNFNIYKSVESYFNDLNKMNAIIKKQTGSESRLVRFPGGSSNTVSRSYSKGIMKTLANELESRGYSYFDWNLGSGDTDGLNTRSKVANNVIKKLNNQTRMVLMHDIKSYSVEAVRDIIEYGLSHGYNFQAININSPTYHHTINN